MSMSCSVCAAPSISFCGHCKKVVYCGKDHQKKDRKEHKPNCFPADVKSHSILGHHLQATRDIFAGEKIFKEAPLIIGPRSNLSQFNKICLGCCQQVSSNYSCSQCKWPVCNVSCEKNPNHANFECDILFKGKVAPAKSQEEYLCITFLRCLLLQQVDPYRFEQLLKLESHVELRKTRPICVEQSNLAIYFLKNKCKMIEIEPNLIDFVYGIVIVNGYGDPSTFAVKLYSKCAKLSHACIPNTKTILGSKGLEILATVEIKAGQPLTQLYGRIFKGTHRRQELLQNIYFFSCSCTRCKDPTELGTYFSAVKCPSKKCQSYLIPKNPLDISPTSKWACNNCNNSLSFIRCVAPALAEIEKESGTHENEGLYSEYEMYQCDNPDVLVTGQLAFTMNAKLQHVYKMLNILRKLESQTVHKNHYSLLPLKTALIATIHSLLALIVDKKHEELLELNKEMKHALLQDFLQMVKDLLEVVEILLPGMTSERGLLLFYLSEGMRFSIHNAKQEGALLPHLISIQLKQLQEESLNIFLLENEDDDHRKLVVKYLSNST